MKHDPELLKGQMERWAREAKRLLEAGQKAEARKALRKAETRRKKLGL